MTGKVRLEAFAEDRLDDPELREIMTRVELSVDAGADAAYPKRRVAVVDVETTDGRHLSHRAPTRKGDPDDPLSDAELDDKFRELVEPVIGHEAGDELLAALWRIDELDDITSLPIGKKS
jgi:2-methylcitrate dehydratase PrpD